MAKTKECNKCKYFKYGLIGKGAGYKCTLKNKSRHYLYKCSCDKYEKGE